ncbi:MAG: hypothetical protein ACK53Y_27640, partial [bacterium]
MRYLPLEGNGENLYSISVPKSLQWLQNKIGKMRISLGWMNSLSSLCVNLEGLHDETKSLLIEIGLEIMKIIRDVPISMST